MVELITGVPGSGKTSYAITRLAKTFSKDEELKKKIPKNFIIPEVDKAFTNINELKTENLNNVNSVHFDELIDQLTILEEKYRKEKWNDKQLNELAETYGINNAMYIIDECHNYFDTPNKVLTWWLSYHRHLHQHIILLTQNLSLVNTKYKAFPELYLKAIPATLKIFDKSIVLKKYTSSRMSKTTQAGQLKVKKFQEIFDLYGSGANHKSKSVILPYLIFAIFLILALLFFVNIFGNNNTVEELKDEQKVNQIKTMNTTKNTPKEEKSTFEDSKLLIVYCIRTECYYKDISFNFRLLNILDEFKSKILFEEIINKTTVKKTLLVSRSFEKLIGYKKKKFILGVKNENGKNSNYYNVGD